MLFVFEVPSSLSSFALSLSALLSEAEVLGLFSELGKFMSR